MWPAVVLVMRLAGSRQKLSCTSQGNILAVDLAKDEQAELDFSMTRDFIFVAIRTTLDLTGPVDPRNHYFLDHTSSAAVVDLSARAAVP